MTTQEQQKNPSSVHNDCSSHQSRSRKPPYPNSILDRQTLSLTALTMLALIIKAAHIDT
jgi:hypothetical protein